MATYAIGDVQGCMASLERLLAAIAPSSDDRLWLVGDLVNRGPRSLDVLRWARANEQRIACVLGNHDLHLLGRAAGTSEPKRRDTLDELLAAPDRDALIDWLRRRPMVHVEGPHLMVHAGLHPRWDAARARALAGELEAGLRSDDWRRWIAQLHGATPAWRDDLTGGERIRAIASFLIRVRTCTPDGVPDPFDGPPEHAPRGCRPWYALPDRAWHDHVVVFGHWAAQGLRLGPDFLALDSGCVWGNRLSAVRLEDRTVFQVKAVEKAS
jgi:bis(5'-nucleosyl)-tetraphosphatase (symmetrical)